MERLESPFHLTGWRQARPCAMQPVKVIHLIKRVEQIDREIAELHGLVDGIDSSRSYRNTLKIAAEQQINNLVGEKVKLMELTIANPPEFLTKHVFEAEQNKQAQPRIPLEALLGASSSTMQVERRPMVPESAPAAPQDNPLRNYARMMNVEEILPKTVVESSARSRRAEKPMAKTRAEILRDLPPLQY